MIATGSILAFATITPVYADTSITISGNGSNSDNSTQVSNSNTSTVVQNNQALITNTITSNSNSGNNSANDNTGGSTSIDTGAASSTVNVTNMVNANQATGGCNSCSGNTTVNVSGNGTGSTNTAGVDSSNSNSTFQTNNAELTNNITTTSTSGNNTASDNTGGNVAVRTGNAGSDVTVHNAVNVNTATSGTTGEGSTAGTVTAHITGNGSNSNNSINLGLSNTNSLVQDNSADFTNNIISNSETGDNSANDNTDGSVLVDTGSATSHTTVDNQANFNAADLSCCLMNVDATVHGNGTGSDNNLSAELTNSQEVFQGGETGNMALFSNFLNPGMESGDNSSDSNTGSLMGSHYELMTGDSSSTTTVRNASNMNVLGGSSLDGLELGFDLNGLMGLFI